jgi:hypothetical protein
MRAAYIFLFDVSQAAIDSNYLYQAAFTIKGIIEESLSAKISVVAYDSHVYLFNLKRKHMYVLSDCVLPVLESELLVEIDDCFDLVMNYLEGMSGYFATANS